MKKVSIIIPAYNEASTIGRVIDEVPCAELQQAGFDVELVVVDNNSGDATSQIAREKGAMVISEKRKGKGIAMRSAFGKVDADYIFMIDADYTYPATHIPQMLGILQNGNTVVIGSRLKGKREKGAMSRLNLVGNHLLTFIANVLYHSNTTDLCSGLWGFRSEVIRGLELTADGFDFEADLFIQIARKRLPISHVPIYYRRRPNQSKLASIKDGLRIGRKLLAERSNGNHQSGQPCN